MKYFVKIISILIVIFMIPSCSFSEVYNTSHISYCTALGIDRATDGITVSVQIVNAAEMKKQQSDTSGGSSGNSASTVISAKADTIGEALSKLKQQNSKELFYKTILVYVINPNLKPKDILDLYDFVIRERETKIQSYLVCAKGSTSQEILEFEPITSEPSGIYISDLLHNNSGGEIFESGFLTTRRTTLDGHINPLLSAISISENNLISNGAGVYSFDGLSFKEFIEPDLVEIVNIMLNRAKKVIYTIDKDITLELKSPKVKLYSNGNKNKIEANISANYAIIDYNVNEKDNIDSMLREKLKQDFTEAYEKIRSEKLDIFGIELYYYKYHNKYLKDFKYSDIDISFNAKVKLINSGLLKYER